MRTLLVLLGLVVLGVVAAMNFGILNIDQTRSAVVQAPAFKADVATVRMGTEQKTVTVPTVSVQKPGETPAAQ